MLCVYIDLATEQRPKPSVRTVGVIIEDEMNSFVCTGKGETLAGGLRLERLTGGGYREEHLVVRYGIGTGTSPVIKVGQQEGDLPIWGVTEQFSVRI